MTINLHQQLSKNLKVGHIAPIAFLTKYKRAKGIECVFCGKLELGMNHHHSCTSTKRNMCKMCHRLFKQPNTFNGDKFFTDVYFCDSKINNLKRQLQCKICNGFADSEDCMSKHKQVCRSFFYCPRCGKREPVSSKNRNDPLQNHNCNSPTTNQ